MLIVFNMLVSLFERAYLLLYEDKMSPKELRRWRSWKTTCASGAGAGISAPTCQSC